MHCAVEMTDGTVVHGSKIVENIEYKNLLDKHVALSYSFRNKNVDCLFRKTIRYVPYFISL